MSHEMLKGLAKTALWAIVALLISILIWGFWGNAQYKESLKMCPECKCVIGLGDFLCWQWQTAREVGPPTPLGPASGNSS